MVGIDAELCLSLGFCTVLVKLVTEGLAFILALFSPSLARLSLLLWSFYLLML